MHLGPLDLESAELCDCPLCRDHVARRCPELGESNGYRLKPAVLKEPVQPVSLMDPWWKRRIFDIF
jgi:hypothetical protein